MKVSIFGLMSITCLICFAAIESVAAQTSNTDQILARLQAASSPEELEKIEDRLNLDRELEKNCDAELRLNVLPKSCFKSLTVERSTAPDWLARECIKRARTSSSRVDLRSEMEVLPLECRAIAKERLADLHYLDVSEQPSEIWTLERKVK